MRVLVLGVLVGVLFGSIEIAFHHSEGEFLAQLTAHVVFGALGTLLAAAALAVFPRLRSKAPAWGAGLCAVFCGIFVWFFREYLAGLRNDPWGSTSHLIVLGKAAGVCGAGVLLLGLCLAKAKLLGDWTKSRLATGLAAGLLLFSLIWTPLRIGNLYQVDLGDWGPLDAAPHNVLLITIDTLRRDHLTQYGYDRPTSHALDRFGFTVFEENIAAANWTKPATASIITGVFPTTHGAHDTMHILPDAAVTLPERLAGRGIATGYCAANVNASGAFNLDQGAHFSSGDPTRPYHPLGGTTLGEVLRQGTRTVRESSNLNRYALSFLEEAADRRFFLYVHYNDPHTPYNPPREYLEMFERPFKGRDLLWPQGKRPIKPAENERMIDRYDGEVADVVDRVVELLEEFESRDLLDNTLVMITADHGEYFGEHDLWTHGTEAFEDLIRIPLLILQPGGSTGLESVAQPTSQVDVVPTILDYLEIPLPGELPGQSLRPFMEGQAIDRDHELLTECTWESIWSFRRGGMKLISRDTENGRQRMLFNLERDLNEAQDLTQSEQGSAMALQFDSECDDWRQALMPTAIPQESIVIEGKLEQELRDLGYVE